MLRFDKLIRSRTYSFVKEPVISDSSKVTNSMTYKSFESHVHIYSQTRCRKSRASEARYLQQDSIIHVARIVMLIIGMME